MTKSYCSEKLPQGFFKIKIKIRVKSPSLATGEANAKTSRGN